MSWKCDVVMDLAPLYYDRIASEGSRRLVRRHLRECAECRAYYRNYHSVSYRHREAEQIQQGQDYARLAKRLRIRRTLLFTGMAAYIGATACIFALRSLHRGK